jgi:tetratricopeptide (TPR) repeat protein
MRPYLRHDNQRGSRLRTAVHLVLLLLAPAIVFSNTLQNTYHLDSVYRVKNNMELNRLWPPWRFFVDRRTGTTIPQIVIYRPMMPLSHAVDVAVARHLGTDRLVVHHASNIVVHTATAILIYALFCVLLIHWSGIDWRPEPLSDRAFAAALLFAVHPISGVPVNYVAGRDLLLMLLFLTASLLVYARMRREGDTVRGWIAVLVLYSLALLSKQNAIMAFAVVFVFEILLVRTRLSDWRLWARVGAFLPGIFGILAADLAVAGPFGLDNVATLPFGVTYPLTMASAHLFYYLRNFVWPFEMRPLARFDLVDSALETKVLVGCGFVVASLIVAWYLRRRCPAVAFSIMTYWVLFALTSSFLPMDYVVTDYRQYPSLPFLTLVTVMGLHTVFRYRLDIAAAAVLFSYFAFSAFNLNAIWRTEESFWGQSIRYGGRELAHMNYAMSIAQKDPELAERHFLETLLIHPNHIYANINLGLFYIRRGDRERGLDLVEKAVSINPKWALSHYWLGQAFRTVGRYDEALTEFRRAADLDPRGVHYQYEAARALQVAGKVEASLPFLKRLQAINLYYRDTLFLIGWAHQSAGRTGLAIAAYKAFLQFEPGHVQTRFNLGHTLLKSGDCREAVAQFHRVLALDEKRKAAHLHLANCYKELGETAKVKKHQADFDRP